MELSQTQVSECFEYTLAILLGGGAETPDARSRVFYDTPEGHNAKPGVYIIPSGFFTGAYGRRDSLPVLPLSRIEDTPLLYGSPEIQQLGDCLIVRADIIASAFFLLTRYEEWIRGDMRDPHGRFPGRESLPYRADFIDRPVVDEYAALLRKWLKAIGVSLKPRATQPTTTLTHDIDLLRKFPKFRHRVRRLVKRLIGHDTAESLSDMVKLTLGLAKDPFDTFPVMFNLDERVGRAGGEGATKVVYFFLATNATEFGGNYDVRSRPARKCIRRVLASGASIGLHAGYEASRHVEVIQQQKDTLEEVCGRPITDNRFHYLSWREIQDGHALARCGITDDYTLGYPDVAGFRLGVCRAIPLFDPINCRLFGITEHPLVVMDVTLSSEMYMGLSPDEAFACCLRLLNQTRKHNGEFTTLWHNNVLSPKNGYHAMLYSRLIDILAREG
jgi:hypothetical protein